MMDATADTGTGCTEGITTAVGSENAAPERIPLAEESVTTVKRRMEDLRLEEEDNRLSPMLFSCYASNIANYNVVVERLPAGTRFFGVQAKVSNRKICYSYQLLLWPLEHCNAQEWQKLADAGVILGAECTNVCVVPSWWNGYSAAQMGREVLSYLISLEREARKNGDQTRWIGEFLHTELFGDSDWEE